jgi:hypothetical protein
LQRTFEHRKHLLVSPRDHEVGSEVPVPGGTDKQRLNKRGLDYWEETHEASRTNLSLLHPQVCD